MNDTVMLPNWLRCTTCDHILPDFEFELIEIDRPAPCCGATGTRAIWPNSARDALEHVMSLDVTTEPGSRTGCLFLAAATEAILDEILWYLIARLDPPVLVARTLMDRVEGRARQLDLYKDLTGHAAKAALADAGRGAWYSAWDDLVHARTISPTGHGTRAGFPDLCPRLWRPCGAMCCGAWQR